MCILISFRIILQWTVSYSNAKKNILFIAIFIWNNITKTYLYNLDPLNPTFNSKTGAYRSKYAQSHHAIDQKT